MHDVATDVTTDDLRRGLLMSDTPAASLIGPSMDEQVAFLKSILESSTEHSIIAKDLDGTILAWNEGARRIYGYEPEDIIGKGAFLLHHREDVAQGKPREILDEAARTGKWSGELRAGCVRTAASSPPWFRSPCAAIQRARRSASR